MAGTQKQRDELTKNLIALQMETVGLTYGDAVDRDEWWNYYTITSLEHNDFKRRAIMLIQKTLKCNKRVAESNFSWWDLSVGLKCRD